METLRCTTFQELACDTWNFIEKGRELDYQLKELTLTDLNLVAIKDRLKNEGVIVKEFTAKEESKNGSDWEWWIEYEENQWVGFRVQAKIINIKDNSFKAFNSKQCKKLIKAAKACDLQPIYCLYLHDKDKKLAEHYGCSVVTADKLLKQKDTKILTLEELAPELTPWHCLVCLEEGCNSFIKGIIENDSYSVKRTSEELPPYVENLIKPDSKNNLNNKDDNLIGGVVIIQKKNNNTGQKTEKHHCPFFL